MNEEHVTYMYAALEEAKKAGHTDEVPIGAVLVHRERQEIVARSHNITRTKSDPTAHAEINVIREETKRSGAQRIPGYDLYVTLEPCPMCAAAISFARVDRVIYGAHDAKSGGISCCDGPKLYSNKAIHHKPEVISGILEDECGTLLTNFFKHKRKK